MNYLAALTGANDDECDVSVRGSIWNMVRFKRFPGM